MDAFARAEAMKKPSPDLMFTDVYKEFTPHLQKQYEQMRRHVQQYKDHYPLDSHDKMPDS
jgi:2-oxoisovalerate dehydrogenase E1 component alpha subunit